MIRASFLAAAVLFAPDAWAQARVQVAPVRLQLAAEKPVSSIRLHNTSDAPVAFVANATKWTQVNGEDQLTPTSDLIVSPPAFVIPPRGEKIVRVGAKKPAKAGEVAFRLLFSEQKLIGAVGEGLRVRLELSLPVFVGVVGAPDAVDVKFVGPGAQRTLRVTNTASGHVMVADARIGSEAINLPRYLLAGAIVERPAPPPASKNLTLKLVQADQLVHKEYRLGADASSHGAAGR